MAAVAALLAVPAAARADVSVTSFSVTPSTTAAGAHPNVTIHEAFSYTSGSDSVKKTVLHFPPGLLGNPQATAKCPMSAFQADTCASNTEVGTISVAATVLGVPSPASPGTVYNLVPDASHPAVLGIVVNTSLGKVFLTSPVSLRTATDFGIDSPVDNTPRTAGPLNTPIQITGIDLTLLGNPPGAKAPFMSNPTSCKAAQTTLDAVSWDAQTKTATASSSFTPTACSGLPFAPKISAVMGAPGSTANGSRVPFTATITQASGQAAQLATSVTLPASLSSGTNVVSTLCTPAELSAAACPAASRIGSATISSPLLPSAVQGPVFAVVGSGLPGVGVEFGGTLPFVLGGSSALAAGGRLQNVFTGLPDVPLSSFALTIDGGPHGLLAANRDLCTGAPSVADGAFTGQNGVAASASTTVTVVGCGSSSVKLRKPRVRVSAAGFRGRHPHLTISVLKGSSPLRTVTIALPKDIKVASTRRGLNATASFRLKRSRVLLTRRGKLTINLPARGASRVAVRLTSRAIHASKRLKAKLKHHRSAALRMTVRTVDTHGRLISTRTKFAARR